MEIKNLHFIGGGRITRIFLHAFKEKGVSFNKIVVTDVDEKVLFKLKSDYSEITTSLENKTDISSADIIFIALHPPVFIENLIKIREFIKKDAVVISLAPKITIQKISEALNRYERIVRMIPNALSIIGKGYNPLTFSSEIESCLKVYLFDFLLPLGHNFETNEQKLEAYAIITAMSPTYYWFQLFELDNIAQQIGLSKKESINGIVCTLKASLDIFENENFSKEDILDLIPIMPLKDMEPFVIKEINEKLMSLYSKIKP